MEIFQPNKKDIKTTTCPICKQSLSAIEYTYDEARLDNAGNVSIIYKGRKMLAECYTDPTDGLVKIQAIKALPKEGLEGITLDDCDWLGLKYCPSCGRKLRRSLKKEEKDNV